MCSNEFSATPTEINQFLKRFKKILTTNPHEPEFVPRRYDFTMLGLDIEMARYELLTLTYHHYDRGPTADHIGDGSDVWEFGKLIDNEMAYIKLKIHNNHCKVLSFKPSTGRFTLPYRNW